MSRHPDDVLDRRRDMVRYACRITGDADHAEDVVQEAYLRLGQSAARRRPDRPAHYLARIVRNLALDRVWASRREATMFVPDGEKRLATIAADAPSPEAEAAGRDQYAILSAALAELPERTRIALEMHRCNGARLREIADALGISITLAHRLVKEGVAHCRDRLR